MASPLGHALAGYAIGWLPERKRTPWLAPACALLAVAPDLELRPRLIAGHPALYHQGPSHSIAAALLAASACAPLVARERGTGCAASLAVRRLRVAPADRLARSDARPPLACRSSGRSRSSLPVARAAAPRDLPFSDGAEGRAAWIGSLLDWRNAFALLVEVALAAPLLAYAWWRQRQRGSSQ